MGILSAILLGIVQGLTEFFPVSSSGHLVLAQEVLGVQMEGILMEVLLHVGTALVVVYFYREQVRYLLTPRFDGERNRYRLAIAVGLIPTALVGVFLRDPIESLFERPQPVLAALAFTGFLLLATRFVLKGDRPISYATAFLIGIAQAFAILPGISRSGATICTALFLGIERKEAARFSFLLSVPAILGAGLLTARDLGGEMMGGSFLLPAVLGTLAAVLSGFLALRYLVRLVLEGTFHRFGWYCLAIAAIGGLLVGPLSG